jgi:amidase
MRAGWWKSKCGVTSRVRVKRIVGEVEVRSRALRSLNGMAPRKMSRGRPRFLNSAVPLLADSIFTMQQISAAISPAHVSTRRRFVHQTSGAAVAAFALSNVIQRLDAARQTKGASTRSNDPNEDPLFMSATKLAELIRSRRISATEATKLVLGQIERVNPRLRAVVTLCSERALAEAHAADAALAAGKSLGPLHGVPMTISDVLDTAGIVSTAGTRGRGGFVPETDATIVARLRAAGAIVIGKTNTTEFAFGAGHETDNSLFGRTRNPYGENLSPGGPSGGAGANVAAGGAAFDLGSGFQGSLRSPAAANGLCGLRPTFGRCPRTGHVAFVGGAYDFLLEVGPLARRVEDLALLLPILAGVDPRDPMILPVPLGSSEDVKLSELRVAFCGSGLSANATASSEVGDLLRACASSFADVGCKVVEDGMPKQTELLASARTFLAAAGAHHFRRLSEKHGAIPPVAPADNPMSSPDFTRTVEELDAIKSEQLAWFERYDLVICPFDTNGGGSLNASAAPEDSRGAAETFVDVCSINGWPAGVVRAGTSRAEREDRLLAALAHVEATTGGYQKPVL